VDIARPDHARKVRRKRILYAVLVVIGVVALSVAVMSLEPAAPSVDAASLWIDTVQRGEMVREVRGPGTLVPEEIRWIPALTEGRVDRILVDPGERVTPDTVILELSDPSVEQAFENAKLQLLAAEADHQNLIVQLQSDLLNQQASCAQVTADYQEAILEAEANEQLAKDDLIPSIDLKRSKIRAEQLANRNRIEELRLAKTQESHDAQLGAEHARLEQARAMFNLRKRERESLKVRSTIAGVLQQVPVEEGQQVSPGTNLARVAQPEILKAELRIAETQARDLLPGLRAKIDTRNGVIEGVVTRVDPAAQEGTVLVDVELPRELPKGARPQLSVDGTIELERLENVLYVGRTAYGQANSTIGLFKLINDGTEAVRVQVQLGRSSVSTFEIVDGLEEGEQIIRSDTSAWDDYDRLRLR
jgi:HlyD family secretion protein